MVLSRKIYPPKNFYPRIKFSAIVLNFFCPTLKNFVCLAKHCLASCLAVFSLAFPLLLGMILLFYMFFIIQRVACLGAFKSTSNRPHVTAVVGWIGWYFHKVINFKTSYVPSCAKVLNGLMFISLLILLPRSVPIIKAEGWTQVSKNSGEKDIYIKHGRIVSHPSNGTSAQPSNWLSNSPTQAPRFLKVLYTNCDQLLNKFDDLLTVIYCDHPDIILLVEVLHTQAQCVPLDYQVCLSLVLPCLPILILTFPTWQLRN